MMIRALVFFGFSCFYLIGCSRVPVYPISSQELSSLRDALKQKEQQVRELQALAQEKDALLAQQEKDIEALKAKLQTFGVF